MNATLKILAVTLASLPAVFLSESGGSKLTFAVQEGTTTTKTFTSKVELTLEDRVIVLNGEESPSPTPEITMITGLEVQVTDEYIEMRKGAPKKLRRSYDSLTGNGELTTGLAGTTPASKTSSELEGKKVVFLWNEETLEYDAAFQDEETDEALLKNLAEDMDLRGFLPKGEVDEGDEWSIAPEILTGVLVPGGDLKFLPEDTQLAAGKAQQEMGDFSDWFSSGIEGKVTATYSGTRKVDDGIEVGVITLEVKIKSSHDLTDKAQEELERGEVPPGISDLEISSQEVETEFGAKGELLWNLAAGHAHSLDLSGEFDLIIDVVISMTTADGKMEMETSLALAGTLVTAARIE
jgi:hypothetical protein